ncbi:hypothetical protein T12_5756 [Trichinella patagoniensis]|uniref:Uncharacterized protein n=1 Tax=Trichinella patagoniensis TaxID=990121 RepID=A0A0V1A5Y7_9BILA|nr:hypothetical protein T12_5756 [Trichinella patagoniensis]
MHHARIIDIAYTYITLFTLELHGKKLIVRASGLRASIVHCSIYFCLANQLYHVPFERIQFHIYQTFQNYNHLIGVSILFTPERFMRSAFIYFMGFHFLSVSVAVGTCSAWPSYILVLYPVSLWELLTSQAQSHAPVVRISFSDCDLKGEGGNRTIRSAKDLARSTVMFSLLRADPDILSMRTVLRLFYLNDEIQRRKVVHTKLSYGNSENLFKNSSPRQQGIDVDRIFEHPYRIFFTIAVIAALKIETYYSSILSYFHCKPILFVYFVGRDDSEHTQYLAA